VGMLYRLRPPSRARADYFWRNRATAHWRPKGMGVGVRATVRFWLMTQALYSSRFLEDAAASARARCWTDVLVCLYRATRIAPWRVARWSWRKLWSLMGDPRSRAHRVPDRVTP
jgi:hypothetical protein